MDGANGQTPGALDGFAEAFTGVIVTAMDHALSNIGAAIIAILIAAPAIASMLMLWAGRRWPRLERSIWINAAAAVALTFASGWAVGTIVFGASELFAADLDAYYPALPRIALVIVLVALWFQFRARASLSWPRAAGVICAALTPVVIVLVQQ